MGSCVSGTVGPVPRGGAAEHVPAVPGPLADVVGPGRFLGSLPGALVGVSIRASALLGWAAGFGRFPVLRWQASWDQIPSRQFFFKKIAVCAILVHGNLAATESPLSASSDLQQPLTLRASSGWFSTRQTRVNPRASPRATLPYFVSAPAKSCERILLSFRWDDDSQSQLLHTSLASEPPVASYFSPHTQSLMNKKE